MQGKLKEKGVLLVLKLLSKVFTVAMLYVVNIVTLPTDMRSAKYFRSNRVL